MKLLTPDCTIKWIIFSLFYTKASIFTKTAFYKNDIKLTIGVEGEFTDYQRYIDYSGGYLSNGIQYVSFPTTAERKFVFGVCWIQPCTEENDTQTWFGANPNLML